MQYLYLVILFLSFLFGGVDYQAEIQPILNNSCTGCHAYGNSSGGLNLTSYDALMSNNVVVPGDASSSSLYERIIRPESQAGDMPPAGSLSQSNIDLIAQWINEGALEAPAVEPFKPQTRDNLIEAVNLWVSDNSSAITIYGEINTWDVSLITDMSNLFSVLENFNGNISSWDVSDVTTMNYMFYNAPNFNQDISSWDVSNVTSMHHMFSGAFNFNQDLSTWDVSDVTTMNAMFSSAHNFNGDISNWDVSSVIDMLNMFRDTHSFNIDLSLWNVLNVTDMAHLFDGATNFNQDISTWNVLNVTDMAHLFDGATNFNQDISTWDVSNVIDMSFLFDGATNFNQDISTWDVSNVMYFEDAFRDNNSLSEENKCAIHTSFSSNNIWDYEWASFCVLSLNESFLSPKKFALQQNYPNPFNPTTSIQYVLPKEIFVDITIHDMMGRKIKTLLSSTQSAGIKIIQWDATNNQNESVSAGMYLITIKAGEFSDMKKMLFLK